MSRRLFLRRAVIGGVGVAGGAVAAGAIFASTNLPASITVKRILALASFHDGNCSMCVTASGGASVSNGMVGDDADLEEIPSVSDTDDADAEDDGGFKIDCNGGAQAPGDFYVFFTAPDLPAGTYSITFTPDPSFSTMGNKPYYRNIYAPGGASAASSDTSSTCPDSINSGAISGTLPGSPPGTFTNNAQLLSDLFPYTVPGTPGDPTPVQDLQLAVHMGYSGHCIGVAPATQNFTFTATLTASNPPQISPVCTGTVIITGTSSCTDAAKCK